MLDGINYTEQDAEFDSQLVYQETEDLNNLTSVDCNNHHSEKNSVADKHFRDAFLSHLRNVRYSKFSRDVLKSQLNNLHATVSSEAVPLNCFQTAMKEAEQSHQKYKEHLRSNSRIYAVDIPNVGQMISDAGLVRVDASMKQLKKDIERDRLLVNGIRLVGAENGLDSILSRISDVCDDVHAECGVPSLGQEVKEFTVLSLLSKASRSHSGGIAFQAAQGLIDPATAMLMPQSAVTPPLKISIHLGVFPSTRGEEMSLFTHTTSKQQPTKAQQATNIDSTQLPSNGHLTPQQPQRWGLVCKVTAESIFKVQLFDMPAEEGYDDCSTAEILGEDGLPCMFRPVYCCSAPTSLHPTTTNTSKICSSSNRGDDGHLSYAIKEQDADISTVNDPPLSPSINSSMKPPFGSPITVDTITAIPSTTTTAASSSTPPIQSRGIDIENRNTYVSVIYEDYVLFEVKLAPSGELSNLENLYDNWKETATVSITEVEPVRTLL